MGYRPIEDYGIIGDLHSVALVGTDGSIDWLCFLHFDSPSVFAAILDDEKGGRFKISHLPDGVTRRQLYWPDTNVLVTRFLSPEGVGEITDYMPRSGSRRKAPLRLRASPRPPWPAAHRRGRTSSPEIGRSVPSAPQAP